MIVRLAAAAVFAFTATGAMAQTAAPVPTNPLQPRVVRPAPSAPAAAPAQTTAPQATSPQATPAKPKRERSAAQLANDDRMRKCGAEWRGNKAALAAQGKTWRAFNVECRARLKAAGQ